MNLLISVAAVDDEGFVVAEDNSVSVDINIVNPCGDDTLQFLQPITSFTYYVDVDGAADVKDPVLSQSLPQCLR